MKSQKDKSLNKFFKLNSQREAKMIEHVEKMMELLRNWNQSIRTRVNWKGFVWKDKNSRLHLDLIKFTLGSNTTCICAIAQTYEEFEAFARELSGLFDAKELVIHDRSIPRCKVLMSNVEPGYCGSLKHLPNSERVNWCNHRPSIKGIVTWKFSNKGYEYYFEN